MEVAINADRAPKLNQIRPAKLLAIKAQMLWNPVKVPMAVAVSFLSVILDVIKGTLLPVLSDNFPK